MNEKQFLWDKSMLFLFLKQVQMLIIHEWFGPKTDAENIEQCDE